MYLADVGPYHFWRPNHGACQQSPQIRSLQVSTFNRLWPLLFKLCPQLTVYPWQFDPDPQASPHALSPPRIDRQILRVDDF